MLQAPAIGRTAWWALVPEAAIEGATVKSVDEHGFVHFEKAGEVVPPRPRHVSECFGTPEEAVDEGIRQAEACRAALDKVIESLRSLRREATTPCRTFSFRPEDLSLAHEEATR